MAETGLEAAWRELVERAHPEFAMEALRADEKRLLERGRVADAKDADARAEYRAIVKHILELGAKESAHG